MDTAAIVIAAYGAFSLIGGIIGYLKAKSFASLIAGVISGVLLILCAGGMGKDSQAALLASAGIALLLGARFTGTWLRRRRVMPDLLMVRFSAAALIADGFALLGR